MKILIVAPTNPISSRVPRQVQDYVTKFGIEGLVICRGSTSTSTGVQKWLLQSALARVAA